MLAQSKQTPGKIRRVGFLAIGSRPSSLGIEQCWAAFPVACGSWVTSRAKDYVIEWRFAEGKAENFASSAAEFARLNVDVIVAATGDGIAAARKATSTIPIVMVAMADPVKAGFVTSLARPGANVTGLSNQSMDIVGKHPELLRARHSRTVEGRRASESDQHDRTDLFETDSSFGERVRNESPAG